MLLLPISALLRIKTIFKKFAKIACSSYQLSSWDSNLLQVLPGWTSSPSPPWWQWWKICRCCQVITSCSYKKIYTNFDFGISRDKQKKSVFVVQISIPKLVGMDPALKKVLALKSAFQYAGIFIYLIYSFKMRYSHTW